MVRYWSHRDIRKYVSIFMFDILNFMKNLLEKINELYGIHATSFEKVSKGFLSKNYILSDGKKKYFL